LSINQSIQVLVQHLTTLPLKIFGQTYFVAGFLSEIDTICATTRIKLNHVTQLSQSDRAAG